jgi:hypothetical protein
MLIVCFLDNPKNLPKIVDTLTISGYGRDVMSEAQ